jgi:copper resistance protein C
MRTLTKLLFACLFAVSSASFGHAVVTHNSLKLSPVPLNQASQVELYFNSKVELDLSEVFLVSAGDKMTSVKASLGNKPGQVLLNLPALPAGEYAIKLKIFAADGHLSEDLLRFHIK